MEKDYPLISCICITRNKPHMLKRAINCFLYQTYSNKELIILYEEDDKLTKAFFVKNDLGPLVRPIEVSTFPKMKLGQLRNKAIEWANGDYICQWDDDDWYHIHRLELQYIALFKNNHKASIMTQWLVFDSTRGNAYISNRRLWEGSIMCQKEAISQTQYDQVERGEDTVVIDYLKSRNCIWEIHDKSYMYIYVYHGRNTWHRSHWNNIFYHSKKLTSTYSGEINAILEGKYSMEKGSYIIDEMFKEYLMTY